MRRIAIPAAATLAMLLPKLFLDAVAPDVSGVIRPRAVRMGRVRAGDFFGEVSLLTGEPRSATVTAVTDCVVYEIRKQDFEPLLKARP